MDTIIVEFREVKVRHSTCRWLLHSERKNYRLGWISLRDNYELGNANDVCSLHIFLLASSGRIFCHLFQGMKLYPIQALAFDTDIEELMTHHQLS